jgi:hypothetical protein
MVGSKPDLGWSQMCSRLVVVLLIGALVSPACTSTQQIRPAVPGQAPSREVQAGDRIVVLTQSGERASFVVQRVEGDAIIAPDGRRFAASDLVRVERKAFSGGKTTALIAAIGGGAFLVVAIAVGSWLEENSR